MEVFVKNEEFEFVDNNNVSVKFVETSNGYKDYRWKVLGFIPQDIKELKFAEKINDFKNYVFDQNFTHNSEIYYDVRKNDGDFLVVFRLIKFTKKQCAFLVLWNNGKRIKKYGFSLNVENEIKNKAVIENEKITWENKDKRFHRTDGPAVIEYYCDLKGVFIKSETHYINGKKHREDGPALINSDGYREWYKNGELHRDDGPAIIHPNGFEEFWINGKPIPKKECSDNKEKTINENGVIKHYYNNRLNKNDGPAVIYPNGCKEWWINGNKLVPPEQYV